MTESAPARRRALTIAVAGAAVLGALLVLLGIGVRATGGDWFIVQTPSMGETAPVGTLVVTAPIGTSPLRVGEIVSFHPPTIPNLTYTHRIASIRPGGLIATRGDINGAEDGWRITRADIVGRVVVVLPGIGWLIKALPLLIGGGAAVWWLSGLIGRPDARVGARMTGFAVLAAVVLTWLHPLFGAMALEVTSVGHEARALVVSTGLLPVRVSTTGGAHTDLVAGQVGSISAEAPTGGHYAFEVSPHLTLVGWIVVAVVCSMPTVIGLVLGRRRALIEP